MMARTARRYDDGVAEVEKILLDTIGTGAAVARAEEDRDRSRLGAVVNPYKERNSVKAADEHARAMHADKSCPTRNCEPCSKSGGGAGYDSANVTLPAEERDHRRRRSGLQAYRPSQNDVEEYVAGRTVATRELGGTG